MIEFYRKKAELELPKELYELENVRINYPESSKDVMDDATGVVEIWKFSKQKQNWLIKHFFNLDEVPSEYNDLLITYFKDLQGRSKDDLSKRCFDKVNEWNEYMAKEDERIAAIVNGDEQGEKDSEKQPEEDEKKEDEVEADKKEEPELVMPNKDVVKRSHQLLKIWCNSEDDLSNIELKNFSA